MSLKELVRYWEQSSQGELSKERYSIHLADDDAARVEALAEMYPRRSREQIISDLLSAALAELETSFPYIEGNKVISLDEMGDPIYEDVGPTPAYLELIKKHLGQQLTKN